MAQKRDRNKAEVERAVKDKNLTPFERTVTHLAAFAESDYDDNAVDQGVTGETNGVFQQHRKWWPTWDKGPYEQAIAFIDNMRKTPPNSDPVIKAWFTQNWTGDLKHDVAHPLGSPAAQERWRIDKRTVNYLNRVARIDKVMNDPKYFENGGT